MSDQPPSKPKPGSLRDRIAAFENKPAAAPGPTPPRPKPAGVSWKPKIPSPPSSPQQGSVSGGAEKKAVGGMNASDAKESIGLGGSLKERMAALQGKGAFGAPDSGASAPPKPATQKPKWKPPPAVSPPADEEKSSSDTGTVVRSPPPIVHKSSEDESPSADTEHRSDRAGEEAEEHDPEEAERQRRAAIAARMARLGGTRVGMAPPVFGKKPSIKKSDPPKDEETQSLDGKPTSSPGDPSLKSSFVEGAPEVETPDKSVAEGSTEYFTGAVPRRSSTSSSLLSVDSASQASKSPSSMPVPSVPRRAAPPRKKIPKSPSPVPDTHILDNQLKDSPETSIDIKSGAVAESEHELQADRQEEIGEVDKEGVGDLPEANKSPAPRKLTPMLSDGHMVDESPQVEENENETKEVFGGDHGTREPEIYVGEPAETHGDSSDIPASAEKETNPVEAAQAGELQEDAVEEPTEDLTEEEEVARRKRVAEKLGKMGGFNPLAPPLVASPPANDGAERKDSVSEEVEHLVASPSKFVSETTRQGSRDSAIALPASPLVHRSTDSPPLASENFPNSRSLSPTASTPPSSSSTSLTSPFQFNFSEGSVSQERPGYDYRRLASGIEAPTRKESTKSVESGNRPDPVSQEDALDLSQPNKEFRRDAEGHERVDDNIRGKQLQERLSPDHEMSTANIEEEADDDGEPFAPHDHNEGSELATENARSIAPVSPVSNISVRPDIVQDSSGLEGLALRSQPPELQAQLEAQDPPVSSRPSRRSIPPPPALVDEETVAQEIPQIQETMKPFEKCAPLSPPQRSMPPLPRQSGDFTTKNLVSPAGPRSQPGKTGSTSVPGTSSFDSPTRLEQQSSSSARPVPHTLVIEDMHEYEILDEEEGDPIDPAFHSPSKTPPRSGDSSLPPTASQEPPVPPVPVLEHDPTSEEDPVDTRRRTIAERMAKLGGIKLGAPSPIGRAPPSAARLETIFPEQPGMPAQENASEEVPLTEEEEERARKQRIASKLAGMGGVGMFGAPQRAPPQPRIRKETSEATAPISSPSPPQRAVPPSRPPPPPNQPDAGSELESHHTSEDGVRVEAEDSELEEVHYDDVVEPEAPPPIPSRGARRSSNLFPAGTTASPPPQKPIQTSRPLPGGRPPIPSIPFNRRSNVPKSSDDFVPSSARMGSFDISLSTPLTASPPSEYVMVEEPVNILSEDAPPPSLRPGRGPPSRPVPPSVTDSGTSGWELPSIPTFDGPQLDLSLSSWSEDSTSYPTPPTSQSPQPPQQAGRPLDQALAKPLADVQLSPDQLMAVWGRVGVQICESATTLFENSKKTLVGDGSYYGFVEAVFRQVPNAMPPSSSGYGYLIYAQTGPSVSRRVSEILPGDVVELYDAKLKGHKGLQSYHQDVGAGEPLVGIVNEFEVKKSKVKIFQANQHVGQQTVESVSYRLDDLKSGVVKIFRVLEA
ncbi:hypothetical protein PILCRDRAFT_821853 [Piloderma croceum F 1598]|uniref:BBC1/AIM3 cysteine proteinase-fold domain-containing protein n=1 Tax=Piloderma croceum (strain F 1598) TaxID=765440 RepID=A0A0C3FP59_PILCF|nr:hypothetical protein PILCRDRAFT_821853 [Piloderma croceum F 1598]